MKWYQIRSDQSLSRVRLFATPWITARQASLSITNSWSSLRLRSIESVMPSSHLILCHPLFLLPPIPPSIRVFYNESVLHIRWPKYWGFSFSISPFKEYSGLISLRISFRILSYILLITPLQYSRLEIPWTEEPGGLQSMGPLRVGHDWATSLSLFIFMHWRRKWQPTPVFLPVSLLTTLNARLWAYPGFFFLFSFFWSWGKMNSFVFSKTLYLINGELVMKQFLSLLEYLSLLFSC